MMRNRLCVGIACRYWFVFSVPVIIAVVMCGVLLIPVGLDAPHHVQAHILTPLPDGSVPPHLEIDMVKDGDHWCDPVDTQVQRIVGQTYQVAVCLTSAAIAPIGFQFDLVYDDTADQCIPVTGGSDLDKNPDANTGYTTFNSVSLGTGWTCNIGGVEPPICDLDTDAGAGHGRAHLKCYTITGTAALPVGPAVSEPIAVVSFRSIAAETDTLALEIVSVIGDTGVGEEIEFVSCWPQGDSCFEGVMYCPSPPTSTVTPVPPDSDNDGVPDNVDNCPLLSNSDQANSDVTRRPAGSQVTGGWASNPSTDIQGDVCDLDSDNDGLPDSLEYVDHCPYRFVADSDGDGEVDGFEVSRGSDPCDPASKAVCTDTTDSDSDGLNNCLEHFGYNTCSVAGDTVPSWSACANAQDSDNDGCADVLEVMDINGDRKVSVGDQTLLAKRGVGLIPASDSDPVFDVNKDGKITVGDQTLMAKNTCQLKPWLIGCSTGVCRPDATPCPGGICPTPTPTRTPPPTATSCPCAPCTPTATFLPPPSPT